MTNSFEKFCTFPHLQENGGYVSISWKTVRNLQNNANLLLQQQPDLTEEKFVRGLLETLKQNPNDKLTQVHLVAFLSRFSCKAAWRVRQALVTQHRSPSDINSLFQDLFQIAFCEASVPNEFFQNFDLNRANNNRWYPSLENFIRKKMYFRLLDEIRKMEGTVTVDRSNYYLVSNCTRTKVVNSLRRAGEAEENISYLILAWQCFQEVKKALPIKSWPTPEQFQEISVRYNQLRQSNTTPYPAINSERMEELLRNIATAVRRYLDWREYSLDAPLPQNEGEDKGSLLDVKPDNSTTLGWEGLERNERRENLNDLNSCLGNIMGKIDIQDERILLLSSLKVLQQQIGIELGLNNQPAVAHQITIAINNLLAQIEIWIRQHGQEINLEELRRIKSYLKEKIKEHYEHLIEVFVSDSIQQHLDDQGKEILTLKYVKYVKKDVKDKDASTKAEELRIARIAEELTITESEVNEKLSSAREFIQNQVAEKIQERIEHRFRTEEAIKKIAVVTEEMLPVALMNLS